MLFYFSVFFGVSLVKKLFSLEFVQNIINSEFSLRIINKVSDMPQAGQIVIGITIIAIIYFVSMIVSIKVYRKRNF